MSGGINFGLPNVDFSGLAQLGQIIAQKQNMEDAKKLYGQQLDAAVAQQGPPSGLAALGAQMPQAASSPSIQPKLPSFSGGAQAMSLPSGTNAEIEGRFVDNLKAGGLTNPYGLAAVAAYANRESGYSPKNIAGAWSDPSQSGQAGTSGGILSWRNDRLANMRAATAGASDPVAAQAKFTLTENPQLTMALQNAKSPEEANRLMANAWKFAGYDQEGGESAARLNATRAYVSRLGGQPVASAPTQVASADMPAPGARSVGFRIPGADPGTQDKEDFTPGTVASPAVAQPQQAQIGALGGGAAPRITPQQAQNLRAMLGNPITQPYAAKIIEGLNQPAEYGFQTVGDNLIRTNKRTGQAEIVPGINKPVNLSTFKGSDGNDYVFNPQTGALTRAVQGEDKNFRDLSPGEVTAAGLPANTVAQRGPDNKLVLPGKAQTEINLNQGVEKAYDSDIGKANAKTFGEIQQAGREAIGQKNTLGVMQKLLERPDFYTGTGGELNTAAKRAFSSLGIADDGSAAPQELFAKLSKQFVLDKAGGSLGGGFSNGDRDFISATTANPSNTVEGNKLIVEMARRSADRAQLTAQMARQYAAQHGGRLDSGFDDVMGQYAEAHPVFDGLIAPKGGTKVPDYVRSGPKAGDVQKGYRFKGGDPADQNSWVKVP